MIAVVVNGERRELPAPMSVAALLAHLGVQALLVAVEIDRAVVPRAELESTVVRGGEVIEIVHFVGGG